MFVMSSGIILDFWSLIMYKLLYWYICCYHRISIMYFMCCRYLHKYNRFPVMHSLCCRNIFRRRRFNVYQLCSRYLYRNDWYCNLYILSYWHLFSCWRSRLY